MPEDLSHWQVSLKPDQRVLSGEYCKLKPLSLEDAPLLFEAFSSNANHQNWLYLPYGPFSDYQAFYNWLVKIKQSYDDFFYSIAIFIDNQLIPVGVASFVNILPEHGNIEIAHVHFSPQLQRTQAATEAMYLMLLYAFETLGYRRVVWKCDNLNERSKKSAKRLGFIFEGIFRQHYIIKGKNRDTAWFAMLDCDWPIQKQRFNCWLDPLNFDVQGKQINAL
ncbi:GNAT family N-acetyltransferase [Thiotrichales bacterium 19X7-9]|nr:GNAT family N-acetyltransferase [Thiotrichales bacterium 19X7-9]